MANTTNLPGRLIGITLNGNYYNCQTAADLTLGTSLTKNPICKPNPAGTMTIAWESSNVDSKNWVITFSAQTFLDSVAGTKNNNDLLTAFIAGDLVVDAQFLTSAALTTDENYDHDFLFEGSGLLTTIKVNAPSTGGSTYDVTITGNGTPVFTLIPSTT